MVKKTKFDLEIDLIRENEKFNTYLQAVNLITQKATEVQNKIHKIEAEIKKIDPEYVEE